MPSGRDGKGREWLKYGCPGCDPMKEHGSREPAGRRGRCLPHRPGSSCLSPEHPQGAQRNSPRRRPPLSHSTATSSPGNGLFQPWREAQLCQARGGTSASDTPPAQGVCRADLDGTRFPPLDLRPERERRDHCIGLPKPASLATSASSGGVQGESSKRELEFMGNGKGETKC